MKRALFIGRFQPFHKGHEAVIKQMEKEKDIDEIIIGIGSSQENHTFLNPFTSTEREKMIKSSLNIKKPYKVIKIPDINNYPLWVSHVESLCPKFDKIYTRNKLVKNLFKNKNYKVKSPRKIKTISGTKIRKLMIKGGSWKKFLPKGSKEIILNIKGLKRLNSLNKDNFI